MKFKSISSSSSEMLFLKNFEIMFSMFFSITNFITIPKKRTLLNLNKIDIFLITRVFYFKQ